MQKMTTTMEHAVSNLRKIDKTVNQTWLGKTQLGIMGALGAFFWRMLAGSPASGTTSTTTKTGHFIAQGTVANLPYTCGVDSSAGNVYSGETGILGTFSYEDGTGCTFRLGQLELSTRDGALDDGVVTPHEVTSTRGEAHVLAAIIQSASLYGGGVLQVNATIAEQILPVTMDLGMISVEDAFRDIEGVQLANPKDVKIELAKYVTKWGTLNRPLDAILADVTVEGESKDGTMGWIDCFAEIGADALVGEIRSDGFFVEESPEGCGLAKFGSSLVMKLFGGGDKADEFSELTEQLDQIQNTLSHVEAQVGELLGDFTELADFLVDQQYADQQKVFRALQNENITILNGFMNKVTKPGKNGAQIALTMDQIVNTPGRCEELNDFFTGADNVLSVPDGGNQPIPQAVADIGNDWLSAAPFGSNPPDHLSSLVLLMDAARNQLATLLPKQGSDPVDADKTTEYLFSQYNEGVIKQFMEVLIALQQFFHYEQAIVLLYSHCSLSQQTPPAQTFTEWLEEKDMPEPDFPVSDEDLQTLLSQLQLIYKQRVDSVNAFFNAQLISSIASS